MEGAFEAGPWQLPLPSANGVIAFLAAVLSTIPDKVQLQHPAGAGSRKSPESLPGTGRATGRVAGPRGIQISRRQHYGPFGGERRPYLNYLGGQKKAGAFEKPNCLQWQPAGRNIFSWYRANQDNLIPQKLQTQSAPAREKRIHRKHRIPVMAKVLPGSDRPAEMGFLQFPAARKAEPKTRLSPRPPQAGFEANDWTNLLL